jgi:hypothetical protein
LLRKLTEAPTENWKTLQSEMKVTLKNELLSVLINEKEKYVKFKICDAITQIAENVYENDENWNELLNYMYSVFTRKYEESEMIQIESSLQLLTSMFGYVCDEVMKGIDVLLGTFKNYFNTNNMTLRARTAQSISEMISICDKKESKLFREFIILILDTTMKCTDDVKEEANVSL